MKRTARPRSCDIDCMQLSVECPGNQYAHLSSLSTFTLTVLTIYLPHLGCPSESNGLCESVRRQRWFGIVDRSIRFPSVDVLDNVLQRLVGAFNQDVVGESGNVGRQELLYQHFDFLCAPKCDSQHSCFLATLGESPVHAQRHPRPLVGLTVSICSRSYFPDTPFPLSRASTRCCSFTTGPRADRSASFTSIVRGSGPLTNIHEQNTILHLPKSLLIDQMPSLLR